MYKICDLIHFYEYHDARGSTAFVILSTAQISVREINPRGFQEVGAPIFQESRRMMAVRLSAVRTGRLYTPGNIPGTHF
jgi:hypothetical protein